MINDGLMERFPKLDIILAQCVLPIENAVLTVGALQAGTKENIIPEVPP